MKKKIVSILIVAAVAIVTASLVLAGCAGGSKGGAWNTVGGNADAADKMMGLTAVGSGAVLDRMNAADTEVPGPTPEEPGTEAPDTTPEVPDTTPGQGGSGQGNGQGSGQGESLTQEQTATIDRYLQIVDHMMTDSGIVVNESASDREGYAKKLEISSIDLYGNTQNFVIYFNERQGAVDWDDDDKDEVKTVLEGIMISGEREYTVIGERETERDEAELEFRAYLDRQNYVEIERKTENGEEEFGYKIVENGRVVEEFELGIEQKAGTVEVEIESFDKNGNAIVIDFEQRERLAGGSVIEAECYENGRVVRFTIHVDKDGEREVRRYQYRDGICYEMYDD